MDSCVSRGPLVTATISYHDAVETGVCGSGIATLRYITAQ
jgi:hypothetical protein